MIDSLSKWEGVSTTVCVLGSSESSLSFPSKSLSDIVSMFHCQNTHVIVKLVQRHVEFLCAEFSLSRVKFSQGIWGTGMGSVWVSFTMSGALLASFQSWSVQWIVGHELSGQHYSYLQVWFTNFDILFYFFISKEVCEPVVILFIALGVMGIDVVITKLMISLLLLARLTFKWLAKYTEV